MASRVIVTKFKSRCALCGEWIEPGVEVMWDRDVVDPKLRITHVKCADPPKETLDEIYGETLPKQKVKTDDLPF